MSKKPILSIIGYAYKLPFFRQFYVVSLYIFDNFWKLFNLSIFKLSIHKYKIIDLWIKLSFNEKGLFYFGFGLSGLLLQNIINTNILIWNCANTYFLMWLPKNLNLFCKVIIL